MHIFLSPSIVFPMKIWLRKLYEKIRGLKASPYIGRRGRIEGTRELLFPPLPYIAVYRISGSDIEIWRIYHGAQFRP